MNLSPLKHLLETFPTRPVTCSVRLNADIKNVVHLIQHTSKDIKQQENTNCERKTSLDFTQPHILYPEYLR